jgi:hypothetical protein
MMPAPHYPAGLITTLSGGPSRWSDLGVTRDELLALCDREDLRGLLFCRVSAPESWADWPAEIRNELAQYTRGETAREMLCREEIANVLSALADAGVRPIVLKGTALAYTVYDTPIARPRLDTDILIDPDDRGEARGVLERCGYAAPPYCDELFAQFQMEKRDRFGLAHVIDVHWKISTQPVFANVLDHAGMWPRARPIPALGPSAVGASPIDALLLACIHPVMHHQNAQRILWTYDTHLLASELGRADWEAFRGRATDARVAGVCAHQLRVAQALFDTRVPAEVMRDLSAASGEPSAAYLASQRTWRHELASSLRGSPRFADRVKLLREVLLPCQDYMLALYGLRGKPLAAWLLPMLYVHRNARGAWKVLSGKK